MGIGILVLLGGAAAAIGFGLIGSSPNRPSSSVAAAASLAASPSPTPEGPATVDFRFLPALTTPPLQPPPTAGPTAAPTPAPAAPSAVLSFSLAGGVAAPKDGASVWVGWTAADGSKLRSGAMVEAGLDRGPLRRVAASPQERILRSARTGRDHVYRLRLSASSGAAPSSVTTAFRLAALDDSDRKVSYSGTWGSAAFRGYLRGSARFSTRPGATATLTFTGRSVAWVGPVGPGRGRATVTVDGVAAGTVSQRASRYRPRQTLFVRSWPESGRHTLKITVAGSRGATVMIDSFTVIGEPARKPAQEPATQPPTTPPPSPDAILPNATLPLRAAFYYGWYPEAWRQNGSEAWTSFHPTAGSYDSSDSSVIAGQIAAMRYGQISAAIASWWGPLTRTDGRMPQLLTASRGTGLSWAINDQVEEVKDLDSAAITDTLRYIADHYANDPAYLRVSGRFVVFVGAGAGDSCAMVDRWTKANTVQAYLVLPAVPGYAGCASQPDQWYASDPTVADQQVGASSYAISAGFSRLGEPARLQRDPARWSASVRAMVASGAAFQLVGSFNQWGDGSSVESAIEWTSASGYGTYLDALHDNGASGPLPSTAPPGSPAPGGSSTDPVLVGAGAIASCGSTNDEATAQILSTVDGTVFTVGDNAFDSGSLQEFQNCYGPSWGAFLPRTRPAAGSREYITPDAAGYFAYFGDAAGPVDKGYYAYDLGNWRIYVLNSNCTKVGGCEAGSAQEAWLRADLEAHPNSCIGAYWHAARFSSGRFADDPRMQPFWQDLYDHGAEFVINGHDHNYQRYAPMTPLGQVDRTKGIREFIVGTGGNGHTSLSTQTPAIREAASDLAYGVLKITLHPAGYDWQFLATSKAPFDDSGADSCH